MKKLPVLLFLFGLIFLAISLEVNLTGSVISTETNVQNNLFFIIGLSLILGSAIFYIKGRSLETIVIPTGGEELNEKRISSAMRSYKKSKDKPYVLVSGFIDRDKRGRVLKETQQYQIYKELRGKHSLKPSDMIIEGRSTDTLENFLYSLDKLKRKKMEHLKIATNPTQYWRFKLFEQEAKREGLVEDSFKIEPLYTRETIPEFLYGIAAYVKDYFRVKSADSLEEARKHKTGVFGRTLKKILSIGKRKRDIKN